MQLSLVIVAPCVFIVEGVRRWVVIGTAGRPAVKRQDEFFLARSPGQEADQAFDLALAFARFLPAAARRPRAEARHPLGGQGTLNQAQADLNPAQDLHHLERPGEDPELDGPLGPVGEVGQVQNVVADAFDLVGGVGAVVVPADAPAIGAAFAVLGAGDGVQALLDVGDHRHQAGQGLGGKLARPADVDVDATAGVDPVSPGLQRSQDLGDLGQALGPLEDRADDLAGVPAVVGGDGTILFRPPADRQVGDLDAAVPRADAEAKTAFFADQMVGGDGLDLDPEGELACFDHGAVSRNSPGRTDVHANISQLRWRSEKGKAICPEFLRNFEIFRRRYDN